MIRINAGAVCASLCSLVLISNSLKAQDMPGIRSGNFGGVNGVFFNPANAADNRYRFDLSLFSVGASVSNNQAGFSLGSSFNGNQVTDQVFNPNARAVSAILNADIHGPSVLFRAGSKSGFALTTRARVLANIEDVDGKFINQITNTNFNDQQLPYTMGSQHNQRLNMTGWTELGLSFGRVLVKHGGHMLKGGVTLKYLGSVTNAYLQVDNLQGTLNADIVKQDVYLNNTTGTLGLGFGGQRLDNFDAGSIFNFSGGSLGADIGFVYEYRPDTAQINGRLRTNYKWRIGLSLLDVGSLKFNRDQNRSASYNVHVTGTQRYYLSEISSLGLDNFKQKFDGQPAYFTPNAASADGTYKIKLPTTLQADIDYSISRRFYINFNAMIALSTATATYTNSYYSTYTVTPRLEGRSLAVYLPFSYNDLRGATVGACFRLGPLFVGSGSIVTALTGNSKQVDLYAGLHLGLFNQRN